MPNIWSLIAIEEGRQYGGNEGYEDNPVAFYRYDSRVPNHKQVAEGDVVFVRNASTVLGAARVESVTSEPGAKLERRCPSCGAVNVRQRATKQPPWRCSKCSSEFLKPVENIIDVVSFTAHYGATFRSAPSSVPASLLKTAAPSPNDQLAIERLDMGLLKASLGSSFPAANDLLVSVVLSTTLAPLEASPTPPVEQYTPWEGDERDAVLRAIRVRRGQQGFRKELIKAHDGRCMISGCELLDILEAAHIAPYKGPADNHVGNGLLLRADLHTLFDLGLMAVDPTSMVVRFSKSACLAGYGPFDGAKIASSLPSAAALKTRWEVFSASHLPQPLLSPLDQ